MSIGMLGRGLGSLWAIVALTTAVTSSMAATTAPEDTPTPTGRLARQLRVLEEPIPVPDYAFVERLPDGRRIDRAMVDYRDRIVLLNFWATWCGVCAKELPKLDAIAKSFENEGIVLLPLSIDESLETARGTLEERGHENLGVFHDAGSTLYSLLGLRGVPTTLVVDATGHAIAVAQGPASWNTPEALDWLRRLVRRVPRPPTVESATTAGLNPP